MYTAMKLRELRERLGGTDYIGVGDKEQELPKSKRKVRLLDEGGQILQVTRIASFCQ